MDFRDYEITRDGDEVVVSGTIHEPVNWDFTIRMTGDDIPGMLRLGLHRHTLAMAARWVFHRSAKPPAASETPATPARSPKQPAASETPAAPARSPKPPAASETPAAPARSPRQPVSPRALATAPEREPPTPASKAAEATPQPPVTSGTSSQTAGTSDFGAPRRRGGPNEGRASVADAGAKGEGR